ncbi:Part of AAA domain-containing protein [Amycolatopsis xylanica]|uniref:DNA 3'-5' helicase n=1 Tax=Amycolatopsis xylanica TaxID=589385 RepID=A0A1H3RYE6_9PSEU|nr:UvrD-helicase domain-containing protein [Amycolatopsis xylanica]SDZ30358.1 Part of AAA domain-containing protein [Amycolatopsis xylanica]
MNLSRHAMRVADQESVKLLAAAFPALDSFRRRVLTAMLARTTGAWHLLAHRRLPDETKADAFVIGPTGVFAVMIAENPPGEAAFQSVMRHAEERCAGIRDYRGQVLHGTSIHFVLVVPGAGNGREPRGLGPYWTLAESDLRKLFQRDAVHLTRRQIEIIAKQAGERLGEYLPMKIGMAKPDRDTAGLLAEEDLTADQISAAQLRPFDAWLTFLHPQQQAIVSRHYNGPARISGPAGTGKTVVALHRLRHLARRSTGPLLFTTFVRTLPAVNEASFRRLAPEVADRVEFIHLHAWLRRLLDERGKSVKVNSAQVTTAFSLAWSAHREVLEPLEPSADYWRTEIDRVIKGRGITTLDDYVKAPRKGRVLRLGPNQKELVWRFFEAYQEKLAEKNLHDHNDMISIALDELTARPLPERYAAVVVDEVQDITLLGLRLLNRLAGDGPNRLLLVGDGQQQVYPGGWRLSDAGIPIQGRGEVLRVNYRNRTEVLSFAQRFDATNEVDDLDGDRGIALLDAESANSGGESRTWRGSLDDLRAELPAQLKGLTVPLGQTALIVFHRRALVQCTKLVREAGIPWLPLDEYTGESDDKLKIGTVHRAKGLDFQAVFVVQFPHREPIGKAAEEESAELRGRQSLVAATRARDFLWWGTVTDG